MISSNKAGANLTGYDAVDSPYAIPFVDAAYKQANSQYNNLPEDGNFHTMDVYYDPNRPTIGGTNQPYQNPSTTGTDEDQAAQGDTESYWSRWNPFRWAPYSGSNDGAESNEQPTDSQTVSANENFAIGAILVIFAGTLIWRKF